MPTRQRIDIISGLPRLEYEQVLRHERVHEWFANTLSQLSYMSSKNSRLIGLRGPAAYLEEMIAYGLEGGMGFQFSPFNTTAQQIF